MWMVLDARSPRFQFKSYRFHLAAWNILTVFINFLKMFVHHVLKNVLPCQPILHKADFWDFQIFHWGSEWIEETPKVAHQKASRDVSSVPNCDETLRFKESFNKEEAGVNMIDVWQLNSMHIASKSWWDWSSRIKKAWLRGALWISGLYWEWSVGSPELPHGGPVTWLPAAEVLRRLEGRSGRWNLRWQRGSHGDYVLWARKAQGAKPWCFNWASWNMLKPRFLVRFSPTSQQGLSVSWHEVGSRWSAVK